MISDVLSEAADELRRYLYSDEWRDVYTGPIRVELVVLLARMDALRARLDTAPAPTSERD